MVARDYFSRRRRRRRTPSRRGAMEEVARERKGERRSWSSALRRRRCRICLPTMSAIVARLRSLDAAAALTAALGL